MLNCVGGSKAAWKALVCCYLLQVFCSEAGLSHLHIQTTLLLPVTPEAHKEGLVKKKCNLSV